MITKPIKCTARINAQDPDYPTYKAIACTAHINANDDGFHGALIDCSANITNLIVTACRSWNQNIRLVVTVNDVDVSDALIGNINISHNKNQASTFGFALNNTDYSPRINSNIDIDKVVVITAYINGQDKKLFTGSVDVPEASHDPLFRVVVTGRDYGKKLIDKKTTVVSVQDLADSTKRNDLIKYLAELAGVTDVDIPEMDAVTIDNSFQDQSIWDMIQKEAMVEQYWIKINEEGQLQCKLDEIKSDADLYPNPDWTYEENRIFRVGYRKEKPAFNSITVLGKTTQRRIPIIVYHDWSEPYMKSWDAEESISWDETYDKFSIEYVQNSTKRGIFYIRTVGGYSFRNIKFQTGGDLLIYFEELFMYGLKRIFVTRSDDGACSFSVILRGFDYDITYETRYDQISATVTDPNSIEKYGELDYGSVEYPLLETEQQCIDVGSRAIRDAHRKIAQVEFVVPFNPLIEVGQTILVTDKKIQLDERYFVENVQHTIDIADGKVTPRTSIGSVLYV